MRLADFILRDMERILARWEAFATTRLHAKGMTSLALRDHAREILLAVARDLRTTQTRQESADKAQGLAPYDESAPETAAQTHATLRAQSGFDIEELASEYRALRASVMRLWLDENRGAPPDVEDIVRFNEAIDQALAESITFFTAYVEHSRHLLLGMLGHDMRSPLQAIHMTASALGALDAGDRVGAAAERILRSSLRLTALLDDLVDYNRSSLGLGMSMHRQPVDLAGPFAEEIDLQRASLPAREIVVRMSGRTDGDWDALRLQQLLGNLVQNAARYGDATSPIDITVDGTADELVFEVANRGPTIDPDVIGSLFEPLRRGPGSDTTGSHANLGLGLFIAREIAEAHGGRIAARSADGETVFSVRLPRAGGDAAASDAPMD